MKKQSLNMPTNLLKVGVLIAELKEKLQAQLEVRAPPTTTQHNQSGYQLTLAPHTMIYLQSVLHTTIVLDIYNLQARQSRHCHFTSEYRLK